VRAFIDVFALEDAGEAAIATNPDIIVLGKVHEDGHKIIVI